MMEKEKLQKIVEQHKVWLDSDGKEGQKANLMGANLTGADFRRDEEGKVNDPFRFR